MHDSESRPTMTHDSEMESYMMNALENQRTMFYQSVKQIFQIAPDRNLEYDVLILTTT